MPEIQRPEAAVTEVDEKSVVEKLKGTAEDIQDLSGPERPTVIVEWQPGDPANPHNWSSRRKALIVFVGLLTMTNGTINTSISTGATPYLAAHFGLAPDSTLLVIPMSLFLAGYGISPVLWAPLSEAYGRRIVILPAFFVYTLFTMASGFATSWGMFLAFRFIVGFCAGCPFSVTTGIFADIYQGKRERGYAIMLINAVTTFGPIIGPLISGFTAPVSWRLPFWVALAIAGVTLVTLFFLLPETFRALLLEKKAQKMQKEDPEKRYVVFDRPHRTWQQTLSITLGRPLRMIFTEPLVIFSCLYLAFLNGVYYLSFESYPIIYQGIYGMKNGVSYLPLLPIAFGSGFAGVVFHYWGNWLQHARKRNVKWDAAAYERLPLACFGGPIFSISLFWLGWSADSHNTHWIVPTLSGFPFGMAIELVFIALTNYIADAYGENYAASAAGASCTTRYLFAAVLPVATKPMYEKLGIGWAGSVLGFASALMAVVPVVFMKYDVEIKARSRIVCKVAQRMKEIESRCDSPTSSGPDAPGSDC